jgi:hypothetical protein
MKFLENWRKWRKISRDFKKLIVQAPEIMDSLLQTAEKTAKDAVLQKLFEEAQTKDMNALLFRKLAESAREGIVISVQMNNANVTFRKEDVYDDMARHRLNQMLQEGSMAQTPVSMPQDLTGEKWR